MQGKQHILALQILPIMCRNCYITTFSAISPGSDFRSAQSAYAPRTCKDYSHNTTMSTIPPELIWAKLDEKKARDARMKAAAKAAKAAKTNDASALTSSAASTYSEFTTCSYDKEDGVDSTSHDIKKKSMGQRLKNVFR